MSAIDVHISRFSDNDHFRFNLFFVYDILPAKTVAEALQAAIAGETHEYTDMYPGMAKTARDEGFDEIADWFETLAKAERSHANKFTKTLEAHLENS